MLNNRIKLFSFDAEISKSFVLFADCCYAHLAIVYFNYVYCLQIYYTATINISALILKFTYCKQSLEMYF